MNGNHLCLNSTSPSSSLQFCRPAQVYPDGWTGRRWTAVVDDDVGVGAVVLGIQTGCVVGKGYHILAISGVGIDGKR